MTTPQRYHMLHDSKINPEVKAGTQVYALLKPDYGLASDDTRHFGVKHISVTLDPSGDYPSFTVPVTDIVEASA